ncbi:hypothetical protein CLOBOL_02537 [Enterocloster bolteae ATCC BAA-613]|uniref:Uncharacterized protein n=1 Tax=Enterocloster bolteae (strain ATCC BAA-613 / DSM 15670 / CCUG 46953 / JCM 12243 / WAL 16351) TaxID=411902 RepID=A8RPQ2_ENTBW|nr:hypothetical protein CLOBOL_02537 [Enterocloster bolteae ATCC BAA-613]
MTHDKTPHNYLMYQRYHKTGKVSVTGVTQETVIKIQKELEHVCQGKEKYIKWTARI